MSYPSRQNTTQSIKSKYNQANLERFLYPASDVDTWLLNLTNRKIDQEINSIHNFEILLNDYKLRCKTSIFVKHYSEVNYI